MISNLCPSRSVVVFGFGGPILGRQGRLLSAKSAWLRNHEMTNFSPDLPFPKGYANFGGPAGGCSLRARCPLMAGTWLVETVLPYRPSNIPLGPGRRSSQDDEQKIRETFHVFIDISGSNRPFAISARQFVLCDVLMLAVGP